MCAMKMMIYPEWMIQAMNENGLTFDDGKDLKKLEGILSSRDLIIYTSINSLHFHDVIGVALCELPGVAPGFDMVDIEPYFMSDNGAVNQFSYGELVNQVYHPEVSGSQIVDLLCNEPGQSVRLDPEVIIGDTLHAVVKATCMDRPEAIQHSMEAIVQKVNDESPIHMEDTAFFDIYIRACYHHAA